jgi:hypothetical protein
MILVFVAVFAITAIGFGAFIADISVAFGAHLHGSGIELRLTHAASYLGHNHPFLSRIFALSIAIFMQNKMILSGECLF